MFILYIILYFIFIVWLYIFIVKRLKILSERHRENTWIQSLSRWYRIVRRRLIFILIILFFLGSLVLVTFTSNDLLHKIWLRDDQTSLDNNGF